MKIRLSDHFTYRKLLRFVFPSIIMMIFSSIYGVIDGLFISNYVGKTPFAAVNLVMPVIMLFSAAGYLFGTGGSAIVAEQLGEKHTQNAKQIFTMLTYVLVIVSLILTSLGEIILPWALRALGANDEMMPHCLLYGRILLVGITPFCLQNYFQSLFVTAGKPHLGLACTVAAGVTNMFGDWFTMGFLGTGVGGAAAATVLSACVGGFIPVFYFARHNSSNLCFVRARINWHAVAKTCTNGVSELMSTLSGSVVNMLYNLQLMRYIGEDGVSAYGVIMYTLFIFIAFFIGYSMGSAPIVSYHYGAGNTDELKNLCRKSLHLISIFAGLITASAFLLAPELSRLFVSYDHDLYVLTVHAFRLVSLCYLFIGFNVFASSFFTALGNGLISGIISFLRMFLFDMAGVLILPLFLGVDGIWLSAMASELCALAVSAFCLVKYRKVYRY